MAGKKDAHLDWASRDFGTDPWRHSLLSLGACVGRGQKTASTLDQAAQLQRRARAHALKVSRFDLAKLAKVSVAALYPPLHKLLDWDEEVTDPAKPFFVVL